MANNNSNHKNKVQQFAQSRAGDLNAIANSKDGHKVQAIMEKDADKLRQAVKTGDASALKNTFDTLMSTEEGARLINKIKDMMEK